MEWVGGRPLRIAKDLKNARARVRMCASACVRASCVCASCVRACWRGINITVIGVIVRGWRAQPVNVALEMQQGFQQLEHGGAIPFAEYQRGGTEVSRLLGLSVSVALGKLTDIGVCL